MMKHKTKRLIAALIFSTALALTGGLTSAVTSSAGPGGKWVAPASASARKNPVAATPASMQEGKKIYGKECISCHGSSGKGNGPKAGDLSKAPSNLTTPDFQSQTDGAIFWKITTGNKPMPTFRTAYSDQDRWSLVNYLRTLKK